LVIDFAMFGKGAIRAGQPLERLTVSRERRTALSFFCRNFRTDGHGEAAERQPLTLLLELL